MKVALVQVPIPEAAEPLAVTPLGLGYIAASVRRAELGIDISVLNLAADGPASALQKLGGYDVYGWSCSSIDYHRAERLSKEIKSRQPDSVHVIGGPHISACARSGEMGLVNTDYWDALFIGEGEETFVQFLQELKSGDVPPGQRVAVGDRLKDLDSLPRPVRDPAHLGGSLLLGSSKPTVAISGSRGCPYSCAFCCTSCVWPGPPRYRSVVGIANEMWELRNQFGIEEFWFTDDRLPGGPQAVSALAKELGPLNVRWRASIRVDEAMNKDSLRALRRAGCTELAIGAESFDDFVLHVLNKKTTAEENERAVNLIHDAGIAVRLLMVVGTPGETARTVDRNIAAIERLRLKVGRLVLSTLMPIPGSPIRSRPASFGVEIIDRDPAHYDIRLWSAEDPQKMNAPYMPMRIGTMTEKQQRSGLLKMRSYVRELRERTGV